jgi:hypothetical protein
MDRDYFQEALHTFNGANWYGWKAHDDSGNQVILMIKEVTYANITIITDGATMPTENEITAKIHELKDAETQKENDKISAAK